MNVYKLYLFDICWMWCMLNGTFVTRKFIDISLWWKIQPQCYERHGGGKGYAKFVIVASTWRVNIFQSLCTIHFYTWWKNHFLSFWPQPNMLILSKKHVRNERLIGLKSHDIHVMVQQVLHVCVRHLMHPAQRHAIQAQRVGKIFQRLCSKIIDPIDIPSLKVYILEMFAYWRVVFCHPFLTSWNIY